MHQTPPRAPLTRSRDDRLLLGVCAGVANHLGFPVLWVRIGFGIALAAGGAGGILYVFLMLTMPEEGESPEVMPLRRVFTQPRAEGAAPADQRGQSAAAPQPPKSVGDAEVSAFAAGPAATRPAHDPTATASPGAAPPARRQLPIAEMLLGGVLVIAGLLLVLTQFGVQVRVQVVLPGLAVLVGVGLTWWLIADRDRPERHQLPRILGALALVAVGVLMFFITAREPSVLTVVGAALAVLAGVSLAVAPWLLRLNRQLGAERAARAREAERADIAAHLHDSVLQSLALIQQRSQPGSDVARIARAQERELREWLFRTADGAAAPDRDTAEAELTAHSITLEAEHAVRFEVVVVGERTVAPEAIVAAAREAMLNAARHAGGDVTVYLETTPGQVRIEVNDRGPGFDPAGVSDERLGVRESIVGRMTRAGGSATITPGPGLTGTSVRLEQPRDTAPQAPASERSAP